MNVNERLMKALADGGWLRLDPYSGSRWYRWIMDDNERQLREELCIVYHGRRIAAWSVWHNERVALPDQDAGRTERLLTFARGES